MGWVGEDDVWMDGFVVTVEGVAVGCRLLFDHDGLSGR